MSVGAALRQGKKVRHIDKLLEAARETEFQPRRKMHCVAAKVGEGVPEQVGLVNRMRVRAMM